MGKEASRGIIIKEAPVAWPWYFLNVMARRSLNLGLLAHGQVVHQGRLSDSLEEGAASLMSRSEKDDFLKRCRVPPEEVTMAKVVKTGSHQSTCICSNYAVKESQKNT